jgi:hypothetical protein
MSNKFIFYAKNGVLEYAKGEIPYESQEEKELKMGEGNENN